MQAIGTGGIQGMDLCSVLLDTPPALQLAAPATSRR